MPTRRSGGKRLEHQSLGTPIAHNLTRAAGILAAGILAACMHAGGMHARATTATIRAHLINIPGRLARSARRLRLHLPEHWPWQVAWQNLYAAIHHPPPRRLTLPHAKQARPENQWKSREDRRPVYAPTHQPITRRSATGQKPVI